MPNPIETWIEAAATAAAIIAIPFYMGIIHLAVPSAIAYAAVGGFAMARGEALQFGGGAVRLTLADIVFWADAILGAGGVAYVLALVLI